MTKLDEVRKLSYSFKLPEDVREGTYVVLRFESEVGKWNQNANIVSYMLGVISHTTKTQFQVSCEGLVSPMRFGRDGGIRADSKGRVGGALRTSVFLAGSVDTAEEYIKGQVEQHNDPDVVRREPTFHLKHADDLMGIIVKLDKLISDATTLWGAIPEKWKGREQRRGRNDRIPHDMLVAILCNPDASDILADLFKSIAKAFGVSNKKEEE
ncbi:hypothetical protein IsfPm1_gp29 [Proteus phage Isf-Pm1]|nr:hypothetical protein IsfPm1_gp29 [Proteus phage Isf-Pm1]